MTYRTVFAVSLALLLVAPVLAQEKKDQNKKKGTAASNAEALRLRAAARGDIDFNGRLYKQDAFKKASKATTVAELDKTTNKTPVSLVGVVTRVAGDNLVVATKRGQAGWTDQLITVANRTKQTIGVDQLLCFYGEKSDVNGKLGFEALLIDKPSGDDLGLSFQYEVRGSKITVGSEVQEYVIAGSVSNTGRIDYSYVEIEAVLESAGDNDVWSAIVRDVQTKSKKPFTIQLSSFQGAYISKVSRPKFTVYIKDFSN